MTLSITEQRVLKHIEEFPESSQPELVAAMRIRTTTMYYAIRTLRAAGLIRVSGWRRNQPPRRRCTASALKPFQRPP